MRDSGTGTPGAGLCRRGRFGLLLPLALVFLAWPAVRTQAFPPTVVLGLYGADLLSSSADSPEDNEAGVAAGAAVDWRAAFPGGGSAALAGSTGWIFAPRATYDQESLQVRFYLPIGGFRLELGSAFASSALGTRDGLPPYLEPSWGITGRWLGDRSPVRPFAGAQGYVVVQPGDDEDTLYQGGTLGVELAPSFLATYRVAVEGGWQRFPEQLLTGEPREDLVAFMRGGAEWLLGYFATGELAARAGYRHSGDAAESRWFAQVDGAVSWSPHRQVNLEGGAFFLGQWYTALALPAPLSGEVWVLSTGFNLGVDWTPDDRWYFVFGASAARSFSADPQERSWDLSLRAGLELSF